MSFFLCVSCSRHVRANAPCPFCGSITSTAIERTRSRRASRAVRFVGAAAIGVACGGTGNPGDGGTNDATEEFSPEPAYGAVAPDAATDSGAKDASTSDVDETDAKSDVGSGALYGAPPPPNGG